MAAETHLFMCLKDNFGVLLHDPATGATAAIDAPEAAPVEAALKAKGWKLTDILVIATCAVIAGAEGWEDIAEYGTSKEPFFRRFLELKNGVPSHDTFERVFAKLDPDAFADRFGRWMAELCASTDLVHVAIDGKSVRGSAKDTFTGCLHLVEAWAVEGRLILAQRSVPDGGHEITTFPEVLATLDLNGAVVTLDAAGCQTETLDLIRERGGEYVVCVKGNQKGLRDAIARVFDRAAEVLKTLPEPFTVSDARRALGTSRRVAVPLLEQLDARRITRRSDDGTRTVV